MAGVRLLLAALASSACALQPVLRFRDPKTRGEVVLVGCMHYNPVSIALASSVVRDEVRSRQRPNPNPNPNPNPQARARALTVRL